MKFCYNLTKYLNIIKFLDFYKTDIKLHTSMINKLAVIQFWTLNIQVKNQKQKNVIMIFKHYDEKINNNIHFQYDTSYALIVHHKVSLCPYLFFLHQSVLFISIYFLQSLFSLLKKNLHQRTQFIFTRKNIN